MNGTNVQHYTANMFFDKDRFIQIKSCIGCTIPLTAIYTTVSPLCARCKLTEGTFFMWFGPAPRSVPFGKLYSRLLILQVI